jgi:RNA polymerase sigma factor (sigma-70 family)
MIRELEFRVLCHRHRDEIYRYAHALLANRADAEDAAQEVLLRLWNHLPTMNPFNIRAWLLRTTRHYCLDQIRRRSNRTAPLLMSDEALDDRPDEFAVNPSCAADSSLRLEVARQALLKLPEKLRSVFVLYEVNGLRYREIAETLEIPINTVNYRRRTMDENLQRLVRELREETCPRRVLDQVARRISAQPRPRSKVRHITVGIMAGLVLLLALGIWRGPTVGKVKRPPEQADRAGLERAQVAEEAGRALGYVGRILLNASARSEKIVLNRTVPPLRNSLATAKNKILNPKEP